MIVPVTATATIAPSATVRRRSGVACAAVLALGIAASFASPPALAAEAAPIPFRANAGDAFKVVVAIDERRFKDGTPEAHVVRTTHYDGRVEAATEQGFRIAWTLRAFDAAIKQDATGNQALVIAAMRSTNAAFKDRPIVFETDRAGSPQRIAGWDALRVDFAKVMQTAMEEVMANAIKSRSPDAPEARVAEIARQQATQLTHTVILRHDARSAVDLFQEAVTVAAVQGSALALGAPTALEDKATGALTDGTVKRTTTFTLAARDAEAGTARLTWSTAFDEAELKAVAAAAIRQQLAQALTQLEDGEIKDDVKRKFEEQIASIVVKRADEGRGTVDLASGWAREVVSDTRIETAQTGHPTDRRERTLTITVTRQP